MKKKHSVPSEEVMAVCSANGGSCACEAESATTRASGASRAAGKKGTTKEEHSGENAEDQPSASPNGVEGSTCSRRGMSVRDQWKGVFSPADSTRLSGVPACRRRSAAAVWLTATKAGMIVMTKVRAKAPGAREMCTL